MIIAGILLIIIGGIAYIDETNKDIGAPILFGCGGIIVLIIGILTLGQSGW